MTPDVLRYVKAANLSGKVLDIGAYDVNGCVRSFFTDYLGVDMRTGPNVDQVVNAHALPFADGSFDHVLCLEMLEHDELFWVSIAEMKRVLRSGGTLLITTRGFHFPRHDYPSDYFRFSTEALASLMDGMHSIETFEYPKDQGVYVKAVKP